MITIFESVKSSFQGHDVSRITVDIFYDDLFAWIAVLILDSELLAEIDKTTGEETPCIGRNEVAFVLSSPIIDLGLLREGSLCQDDQLKPKKRVKQRYQLAYIKLRNKLLGQRLSR